MRWIAAARERARGLFFRRREDAETERELQFHIEMETKRLMRQGGLEETEARRRALVAFGGIERYKEEVRDARGLAWVTGLSLDFKLALRILVKYPGLTIVGGLAMAFAVWVGVVAFEMVGAAVSPKLPLPDGDRIVRVRTWNVEANDTESRVVNDFLVWRRTLQSLTDVGAYRDVAQNLTGDDGAASPVVGAEVTASAFRIAPERPLLGRTLVAADEEAGAPPVVVLGHGVWRNRFASDPQVVGRSVRLGDAFATVVGVMPEGFEFPVSHELWTPLRAASLDRGPRTGPGIAVFGRLAPGATMETAQAELTAVGRRAAAESPATHARLEPRVEPYTASNGFQAAGTFPLLMSVNFFAVMLLVLICGNVALLLFARAATRESEIIVRTALGASRGRIVAQLFAEALVLGGVATVVGLAAAGYALRAWGTPFLERNLGRLPFWIDPHLSPAALGYAIALAILGAVIAGVVPALKITRGLSARLKQGTAGAGGPKFGGVWTAVIVAQVAATVAFPAVAFVEQRELVRMRSIQPAFATEEFLGLRLQMDAAAAPAAGAEAADSAHRARFGAALATLRRRVESEPGVEGVTFVDRMPRMYHREQWAELDDAARTGYEVSTALVDPSYFAVLETPIVAGRGFGAAELGADARVAIVDRGFVDQVLKGRNPIGRRVRLSEGRTLDENVPESSRPWFEIVGVVEDLGMGHVAQRGRPAGLYLPAAMGNAANAGGTHMMVHVRGDPMSLAPRLRTIATAVDPTLRLAEFQRLDEVSNTVLWIIGLWLRITLVLSAVALLLSLAGIYAVLSFTVARRTREIGVRVALGASPRRVVTAIFRRPLTQVGVGVVAGGVLVAVGAFALAGHVPDGGAPAGGVGGLSLAQVAALLGYVTFMLCVCLLACVVPTWRALRVEPTEALRVE
ncbi:MAG: ABC transporter permease [Gemmatimonadaceae bacterium]